MSYCAWLAKISSALFRASMNRGIMTQSTTVKLFQDKNIRALWDEERGINQRLKTIEVRKQLTDTWDKGGIKRWTF